MLKLSLDKNTVEEIVIEALRVFKKGGIVAYPTESFYALGVMAYDEAALRRLHQLKKRPVEKAMPLIVGSRDILNIIVKSVPAQAEELMKNYWPGPLTIIFDAKENLSMLLISDKNKIAVRIPGDSFALSLAKTADFPITATSANISGKPPAQNSEEVINYFGENIDLVVNGPKTPGGKPSTIIDATVSPPKILREGSILLT